MFGLFIGVVMLVIGMVLIVNEERPQVFGILFTIIGTIVVMAGLLDVGGNFHLNKANQPTRLAVTDTLYVVPGASLEGLAIMTDSTGQLAVRRFTAQHVVPSVLK